MNDWIQTLSYPVAFKFFGIPIHWYGIIIACGMLIAIDLICREVRRKGFDDDEVLTLIIWIVIFGFIGARIYYVVFEWDYYSQHPEDIIKIWNGGIAIYGGIIGGLLTLLIYCKRHHWNALFLTDVGTPYLLLAQAIGRWGNFANQEAHGGPVSEGFLRDTLHLPNFIVNRMNIDGVYYQPTFLYESVWNVIGVVVLLLIRKYWKNCKVGDITLGYVIWYSFGRFFIEGLRTDSLYLGPFRVSQLLSLILFIGAWVIVLIRSRHRDRFQNYRDVHGPLYGQVAGESHDK